MPDVSLNACQRTEGLLWTICACNSLYPLSPFQQPSLHNSIIRSSDDGGHLDWKRRALLKCTTPAAVEQRGCSKAKSQGIVTEAAKLKEGSHYKGYRPARCLQWGYEALSLTIAQARGRQRGMLMKLQETHLWHLWWQSLKFWTWMGALSSQADCWHRKAASGNPTSQVLKS